MEEMAVEKSLKSKDDNLTHAKKLPPEIVGRFMQNLSVGDRLKSERVSPGWKRALEKWGWTEQRKLDDDIVLEGASYEERDRFRENSLALDDAGSCHQLISLFHHIGQNLKELDLFSFRFGIFREFIPKVAESLQFFPRLEKLDIGDFNLSDFMDYLPTTLKHLTIEENITVEVETLEALSNRCPGLEDVPFRNLKHPDKIIDTICELIGKFPRQKTLFLPHFSLISKRPGALASIGQLKELELLVLFRYEDLDEESFEAIVEGCERLRWFTFDARHLNEKALFKLAKMPELRVLCVDDDNCEFTDSVLKAIARRGKFEKLFIWALADDERGLTDESVVYLVDRCKSLSSLDFVESPLVTERSLEAVIAEVQRRHGTSPQTFPMDHLDPGIFYFNATYIDEDVAHEMIGDDNPWLIFSGDPRKTY